jgi:hypothetical protein
MQEDGTTRFSSSMPIIIYTRPEDNPKQEWQELDRGPGYFTVPAGHVVHVRIKSINNEELYELVKELQDVEPLRYLDLSENRNVSNEGVARLKALPQLTGLNLSSVAVTNTGLNPLKELTNLEYLNLSYCNKLDNTALKPLEEMRSLRDVNLLGCLGITTSGLARVRRRNLNLHR